MRRALSSSKVGLLVAAALLSGALAYGKDDADPARLRLATGQFITPTAIPGASQQLLNPGLPNYPNFVAGEAVRSALSPDGSTLAILCAGQNSLDFPFGLPSYPPGKNPGDLDVANSTQYLFLYDVSGSHRGSPALLQVIQQTNAHVGLAFGRDGKLYAAGGNDDAVYVYARSGTAWAPSRKIALGHAGVGIGVGVKPNASGLAVSADGATLVVANNYNDSISVVDTGSGVVRYEHDLRPFFSGNEGQSGGVGGSYPFAVVIKGNQTAYVSSDRDREVIAIDISNASAGKLIKRIKLDGNALGMTLDATGSRLFVAQDNADRVAVIDTRSNGVIASIDARGPEWILGGDDDDRDDEHHGSHRGARYTGAATFSLTLSPDGKTLYAVNAGSNSIAVIPLGGHGSYRVTGLIPTAYEPHDVTFSGDGSWMYIVNGKNVTGPNPEHLASNTARITWSTTLGGSAAAAQSNAANQYQFQLERASLVAAPVPGEEALERLTRQVASNNFYDGEHEHDREVMAALRRHIKHVIYIVKENRTFDQILGDLGNGSNGDASRTQFPEPFTPNFHRLARGFVTLDNFTDPGDGSMDGWSWSLQGRVTNTETITQQINYAFVNRGLSYESEGMNRNAAVNLGTVAERDAAAGPSGTTNYSTATAGLPGGTPNVLTGTGNHASSDAPFGKQRGYIFDAVLHAGGTVRNYGFLVSNIGPICSGGKAPPCPGAEVSDPFGANVVQVAPLDTSLLSLTDVYFRGYDQNYPDLWRYNEWKREFDQYVANDNLPSLTLMRVSHDHMGSFGTALAAVNTPETQQADDDLAVGLLVQAVANSRYATNTLIIVTEDDCQDGPDHVDSHRATAYVIGPYVKQGAVISRHYSQVNALRTIEDLFGTEHLNLNTAFQRPMTDVFDPHSSGHWSYQAVASTVLKTTQLVPPGGVSWAKGPDMKSRHDARYWARVTAGFDFSDADLVPPLRFNKVLWRGTMGNRPYPPLVGSQLASDD
jgi:DNA-binding beta-propeller fold protein YncE